MFPFRRKNILYLFLWLLIIASVCANSNVTPTNLANTDPDTHSAMSNDSYCTYPKDAFYFFTHWLCPAVDSLCIIDSPFDNQILYDRIRCSTATYQQNNSLELLSSAEMFKRIEFQLQTQGLSICMLTAFYAPNCYFSAQMAPHLNAVPRMFPRLRVVAVDASESSKLYTRYGIIGTPTVILWVNGLPAFRMDKAPFSLHSFMSFVENRTDLEAVRSVNITEEDRLGPLFCKYEAPAVDWLFVASIVSMVLSLCYFLHISNILKTFLTTVRRRWLNRFI